MTSGADLRERTKASASRSIKLYAHLQQAHRFDDAAMVLGKQLLRSGTSVAANHREAKHTRSKADRIAKFNISIFVTSIKALHSARDDVLRSTFYVHKGRIMKPPEECASLAEVREAIDTLDRELLALLGKRAGYVHAAARFKTDAASVRAPERVRAMLERRRAWAAEEGLDPDVVSQLFTLLVEYFTRREQGVVDARGAGQEGEDA